MHSKLPVAEFRLVHIDKDSPAEVVETETGETELLVHGSDVENAMIAVKGRGEREG